MPAFTGPPGRSEIPSLRGVLPKITFSPSSIGHRDPNPKEPKELAYCKQIDKRFKPLQTRITRFAHVLLPNLST
jgi:hypothetical protein